MSKRLSLAIALSILAAIFVELDIPER